MTKILKINGDSETLGFNSGIQKLIENVKNDIGNVNDTSLRTKKVHQAIKRFIFLGKKLFQSEPTIESIETILDFLSNIFIQFGLKQIYRLNSIEDIRAYTGLSLEQMFVNNILIQSLGHGGLEGAYGGSCVNWSIFFFELFKEIGGGKIEAKFIQESPNSIHIACLLLYEGKAWLLDPNKKPQIHEIKIGEPVIGWNNSKSITSLSPFTLSNYSGVKEFGMNKILEHTEYYGIRVQSHLQERKFDLLVTSSDGQLLIQFEEFVKNPHTHKIGTHTLISSKIKKEEVQKKLEHIKYNLFETDDILVYLLEGEVSKQTLGQLKYIAEKVSKHEIYSYLEKFCKN